MSALLNSVSDIPRHTTVLQNSEPLQEHPKKRMAPTDTTMEPLKKMRKGNLRVVQMNTPEELCKLVPILTEWKKTAEILHQQAVQQKISESDEYNSAKEAAHGFEREFSSPVDFSDKFYFACYDDNQLEGCMFLLPSIKANYPFTKYPRYLVIDLIMTNPNNISSSLMEMATRTSGVGSALIRKAEHLAKSENFHGLILYPYPSAIGFYKRMGFKMLNDDLMKKKLPASTQVIPKTDVQSNGSHTAPASGASE